MLLLLYVRCCRFDAAGQFQQDMSQCTDPDYCALFPSAEARWDLPRISRLCRQGRYTAAAEEGRQAAELGVLALFRDLQRMVAQSKAFNACNAAFLPWRLADMLGCAVGRLQRVLAEKRGMACLQRCLEEDEQERLLQAEDNQAVDI